MNGEKIRHKGKANLFMWMVIFIMDFGQMIKLMDMEFINMLMELNMKENGRMTYNMEEVLKLGLMDLNMMEIMHLVESMV